MVDAERVSVYLPPAAASVARRLAERRQRTLSGIMREALGVLQAIDDATARGEYVGTAKDPEALDTVIVVPL